MSAPPTRIFLVRHGTAAGAEGLAVGQIDLPLAAAGAESLRRLAATWQGPPPDLLLSSDLRRAAASADLLAKAWGIEVAARDPRLREMDFGHWDGLGWDELRDREGEGFTSWMKRWWHDPAPGGESMGDVASRTQTWLEEVLASCAGRTVVAVGHGGSIRTLLAHALDMPGERVFHLRLDHGQVSALETSWRGLEVAFMNADRFHPS